LNTEPRENHFLSQLLPHFEGDGEAAYPGFIQEMKFGCVILNWGQKGNPRNDVFLILPERKHSKRQSVSKAMITVQWD
jgi:hypothetical protein